MPLRPSAPRTAGLAVALAIAVGLSCDRANPFYDGPAGQAGATGGAGTGGSATGGQPGTGGSATGGQSGASGGATGMAGVDGGGSDASGPCVDNDGDGFGVGPGCAGPDCDDDDPNVGRAAARTCYEGKAGTKDVGPCHGGTQTCADGTWGSCVGQVLPALGEACNGIDDDCDGTPDDNLGKATCGLGACAVTVDACANGAPVVCTPGPLQSFNDDCDGKDDDCDGAVDEDCATACVHVAPTGDDQNAIGTIFRPFRTIQAAITYATGFGRAKNVCVAGGPTCGADNPNVYALGDAGTLTMANGVSVYGNYETRTWTRCAFEGDPTGTPVLNTVIQARSGKVVLFPSTVTIPTILDGVRVSRPNGGGMGPGGGGMSNGNATPSIGISVEGAKQVLISNVVVEDTSDAATTYGISLTGGAEATITRSEIGAGAGATEAIGIRSVASKPTIRDNCDTFDPVTGRCTETCDAASIGVHGRFAQSNGGDSVAIDLTDSLAGTVVEHNSLCGGQAPTAAGVRVSGAANGVVVRGNSILVQGATVQASGVAFGPCSDAAPWIVGNDLIQADGAGMDARVFGVVANGACHPVVDGNIKILGGGLGQPILSTGVSCGVAVGAASRCLVSGNKLIEGSASVHPMIATAVDCSGGGCARVSGNRLLGGGGATVTALSIATTDAFVERNDVTGGCGTKSTFGVVASDAASRFENNVVRGAACAGQQAPSPEVSALRVRVSTLRELDVESNTIDAGGVGMCAATAVDLGPDGSVTTAGARGVFRDNILRAGACTISRYDFVEDVAKTGPRVFSYNDLDPTGITATQLYLRGGAASGVPLAVVNGLAGNGNISAAPQFVSASDFHLGPLSPCVNAGTPNGAPKTDFDGKARDAMPDIGAYER
ncbi:MAG TPA: choice-of-anchor Q domain-containing protein [Polyangia bacterium]|nr:choice-of-anchor Q domain-containing protein [Polyangia bacterium]